MPKKPTLTVVEHPSILAQGSEQVVIVQVFPTPENATEIEQLEWNAADKVIREKQRFVPGGHVHIISTKMMPRNPYSKSLSRLVVVRYIIGNEPTLPIQL